MMMMMMTYYYIENKDFRWSKLCLELFRYIVSQYLPSWDSCKNRYSHFQWFPDHHVTHFWWSPDLWRRTRLHIRCCHPGRCWEGTPGSWFMSFWNATTRSFRRTGLTLNLSVVHVGHNQWLEWKCRPGGLVIQTYENSGGLWELGARPPLH